MAIVDQRQLTFDTVSIMQIIDFSPDAALSIGFPNNRPTKVVLNPSDHSVTFEFAGTVVKIQSEILAALLISYCIRSRIKVPRNAQRSIRIEPTAAILVFCQEYSSVPVPTSINAERRLHVRG